MCDWVATPPHRFPAHSLSPSRGYLSTKICNLSFVEEAGRDLSVAGEFRTKHFDSGTDADVISHRFVDYAHATLSNLAEDTVVTDALVRVGAVLS